MRDVAVILGDLLTAESAHAAAVVTDPDSRAGLHYRDARDAALRRLVGETAALPNPMCAVAATLSDSEAMSVLNELRLRVPFWRARALIAPRDAPLTMPADGSDPWG